MPFLVAILVSFTLLSMKKRKKMSNFKITIFYVIENKVNREKKEKKKKKSIDYLLLTLIS